MTDQELIIHLSRKVATLEIEVKQNWEWYKKANAEKERLIAENLKLQEEIIQLSKLPLIA